MRDLEDLFAALAKSEFRCRQRLGPKERVELAQSKGTFWQDYKFTNPVSKKIEPKQMYCEKLDDAVVCGGVYK